MRRDHIQATGLLVAVVSLLATAVAAAPTAAAHIDYCHAAGVCVYEWSWNWGNGSCRDGQQIWWSHRVARASHDDGVTHREVTLRSYCDAYNGTSSASSSFRLTVVETRNTDGRESTTTFHWYGAEGEWGSYCTMRLTFHNQDTLPEGVVDEPCPARPPFLLFT